MQDGIGNGTNSFIDNMENVDFSNNTISGTYDDTLEMDGGAINLRVWGNHLTGSPGDLNGAVTAAISEAGTMVGPSYVFRNYIVTHTAGGFGVKGGHRAVGWCFFFHNTIVTDGSGSGQSGLTSGDSQNHTYRNNILKTAGNVYENEGRIALGNSYDYQCAWVTRPGYDAVYHWDLTTTYNLWTDFTAATGQEAHSVNADPLLDGSYHIAAGSPARNAGLVLANFNSLDSAWPYTGIAPDLGAYEVP
jgi:hypothetical protein